MDKKDLKQLTKTELEAIGREKGIELDRRLSKSKLIEQLQHVKAAITGKITKAKSTKARKTFREINGIPPKSSK